MKFRDVCVRTLKRAFLPNRMLRAYFLEKNKKKKPTANKNLQLELYSKILDQDFLHYGYFDDPAITPDEISFADLNRAQMRYAEKIIEKIDSGPVLDIGAGMGGLSALLQKKGYKATALTPDEHQIAYIQKKYSDIETLHCRFEDIDTEKFENSFETVVTSESFQYLRLEQAIDCMKKVLAPGGKWVLCDYFRKDCAFEKSGHNWDQFKQMVSEKGGTIHFSEDITPNVLPMLSYLYMLAQKVGQPLLSYASAKFQAKNPGLYYLADELTTSLQTRSEKQIEVINPKRFATEKCYMLVVIVFI